MSSAANDRIENLPSDESRRPQEERTGSPRQAEGLTAQAVDRAREFRQRVFGQRMLGMFVAELIREGRGDSA